MDAEEFEQSVYDRAEIPPGHAGVIIQATLQTLAERLSGSEVRDLATQLPTPMKEWLTPAVEPGRSFGADEFIGRVSDLARVPPDTARRAARAVLTTVREAVTEGEFKDVMSQLPGEFRAVARRALQPAPTGTDMPRRTAGKSARMLWTPLTTGVAAGTGRLAVSISVRAEPAYLLVSVAGDCDITTGQQCRDALMTQVYRASLRLIVELSGVGFMDCAGVRVLLAVHAVAAARGSSLVLASPRPIVARVLSLTRTDAVIPVADSVAAAAALGCGR